MQQRWGQHSGQSQEPPSSVSPPDKLEHKSAFEWIHLFETKSSLFSFYPLRPFLTLVIVCGIHEDPEGPRTELYQGWLSETPYYIFISNRSLSFTFVELGQTQRIYKLVLH